jgi:gliding motility-associated-like protein
MRKLSTYIILIIINSMLWKVHAQVNCITDPPVAPQLMSVSVEPETGFTVLNWALSPSPDIAAYIIYTYKDGDGMPVDTIWDPAATSHILPTVSTKYYSTSYVISAMRLPRCTSILSNSLTTIYLQAIIDSCSRTLTIRWNRYPSQPKKVESYTIFQSVNNDILNKLTDVPADSSSYAIMDFLTGQTYCFYVQANLEDGTVSTSNKICAVIKMQKPPAWINADYATVETDKEIHLSFTIDDDTDIKTYSLEKKTGPTGAFSEIKRFSDISGSLAYNDQDADLNRVNYYRLSAINNCNIPLATSNICSNIVLSLNKEGDNLLFTWNPYRQWNGDILSYRLFSDTGEGYRETDVISSADTSAILSYKDIMYNVTGSTVCFFLSATETGNVHGISGESHSCTICTEPLEIITVPNLFTPDNDLVNDRFKPVLSFTPGEYHLVINDTKGRTVFDTRDYLEEWDGTFNGTPSSQGVYLWFLDLKTPSGKSIKRTGTVTIIRKH